jgi:uncharacterized protein (TIGR02444 family)
MSDAIGRPPENALWRFALAFYAQPNVSAALLGLQDSAGCDINLILFALWLGVSGRSRLTSEALDTADRLAWPIRSAVVEPLRALRRKLRSDPDADIQRLREGVKALELEAEKLILDRLARTAEAPSSATDPASRLTAAHANLALYLGSETSGGTHAATIRKALQAFRCHQASLDGSPQRRTPPVSRPKRSRTRPKV